jgi:hypothetical protein
MVSTPGQCHEQRHPRAWQGGISDLEIPQGPLVKKDGLPDIPELIQVDPGHRVPKTPPGKDPSRRLRLPGYGKFPPQLSQAVKRRRCDPGVLTHRCFRTAVAGFNKPKIRRSNVSNKESMGVSHTNGDVKQKPSVGRGRTNWAL